MRAQLQDLLWGATHVEQGAVAWRAPLRAAGVITAVVAISVAADRPEIALPLGLGSLFAGIADTGEEPGQRWRTLLWTTAWMSTCALIGGLIADRPWLEIGVAAVVALLAGFVGAAGKRAALIGMLALVVFTIAAGRAESPTAAVEWALLIALGGAAQSAVSILSPLLTQPRTVIRRWQAPPPPPLLPRLRAHLGWSDTFARHAVRLSIAIVVASMVATFGPFPDEYWIPMTVAWLARPDQHGTVNRVLQRVLGTVLAIVATVALIDGLQLGRFQLTALVGISAFIALAYMWANYALAVTGVTMTVLTLFAIEGEFVGETVAMRLIATVIGGGITIAAGLLWRPAPQPS